MEEEPKKNFKQTVAENLEKLKDWSTDYSLMPDLQEKELKLFLESCNYDIEETKNTLVSYYKLRIQSPEIFTNRNPLAKDVITAATIGYSILLPGATEEGYKVMMSGYFHTDTSEYVYVDLMKRYLMTIDMWLSKLDSCPGLLVLIDCKNTTMGHMVGASLDIMKKVVVYFQEALPVRLRGVYFINISPAMNLLLSIVQPFLSKRITSMIHKFVKGNESFNSVIPLRMLPLELRGEAGTIRELHDKVQQDLEDYTDWFLEEDKKIQVLAEKIKS